MTHPAPTGYHIALIGATGGIGKAFQKLLSNSGRNTLYCFNRTTSKMENLPNCHNFQIDISNEHDIALASTQLTTAPPLDLVLITTGLLHSSDKSIFPEKSLKDLSGDILSELFLVNAIGPALIGKYFIPLLQTQRKSVFAALSARVSSISDNHLGGWYGYRASKTALNMFLKTISIETTRTNPNVIVMGLHPGTVATNLSYPFQKKIPSQKLFTPEFAAQKLIRVIEQADSSYHGHLYDWQGHKIPF